MNTTAQEKLQGYRLELLHLTHAINQERQHFHCPHNLIDQQRQIHNEIIRIKDHIYRLEVS